MLSPANALGSRPKSMFYFIEKLSDSVSVIASSRKFMLKAISQKFFHAASTKVLSANFYNYNILTEKAIV